jgi:D-3-phosphoglycerate dehydrogenase
VSEPFRVLISDSMSPLAAEILAASPAIQVDYRDKLTADEIKSVIDQYDGLIVRSRTQVTAELLAVATRLRIIGRAGIGVDNIDLTEASRRGVLVENTPSGNAVTTAEHALCLLLSLARHIPQASASMRAGKWEKNKFSGHELLGKTLGVVGLGNIGRIVADRARGLKMKVIGHDPFIGSEAAQRLGVELVDFDALCERSDFITVHAPLTNTTRGLIGAKAIARMKSGVLLVNAARGGIVDEAALIDGLESGKIAGAALDVFEQEPPPADHPLLAHPRVIATPHLGASTGEAQEKVAIEIAEQFVAYAERGEVRNAVNMAPMSAEAMVELAPWLGLCERLGSLVGQLAHGGLGNGKKAIDELTVEVAGDVAQLGATPCAHAALVGLLRTFMDYPVNGVNAPIIARERGLNVIEIKRDKDIDLTSSIALTARCGDTSLYAKGTCYHIGQRLAARVVQIDNFLVEAEPSGRLLVVKNQDRPGVIGAVGSRLGARGINVNSLHVGLDRTSGVAVALWNVDAELAAEMVQEINDLPEVTRALVVEL